MRLRRSTKRQDPRCIIIMAESDSLKEWILLSGGDTELVKVLKENGFSSKLSMKKMEFDCPQGEQILKQLTYGQQCLLKALVEALLKEDSESSSSSTVPYINGAKKAVSLASNKGSLKEKIGKLFHFGAGSSSAVGSSTSKLKLTTTTSDEDSFQPMPAYSRSKGKRSIKRKGATAEILMEKGPVKKKVKQVVLPVVGLQEYCNRTPTGAARSKLTRDVWISTGSSEVVVKSKIAESFGWENTTHIGFLFAQGRSLRRASLSDVENSS